MHVIEELILDRLSGSLKRSAITRCSKWSETYRVMGPPYSGKWSFLHHPWLKKMCDSEATLNIGRKAAQMGFTECCLNRALFAIDIHQRSVLYVLPSKTPDASDFSAARFDGALELSDHLQKIFSDVKNVGHKRAGAASLYIRGSRSRSGLKSLPASDLFFDEVDEMVQDNLSLARERSSGQLVKFEWRVSTPTIPEYGIDEEYQKSNKQTFFIKCPHCSKFVYLDFPECLVITADNILDPEIRKSYICCPECKKELSHKEKPEWQANNEWVAENPTVNVDGWWIPQFYSNTVEPYELAIAYLKGLTNPAYEQEFFNSKLGKPYIVKGAKINDENLNACIKSYSKQTSKQANRLVTMGVDVGKWLHYVICEWVIEANSLVTPDLNMFCKCKVIEESKCPSFDNLDTLMKQFQVNLCVIDPNPERRKAFEFAMRFMGHVKLCFYANNVNGKNINADKTETYKVSVDRTSWMDLALGRFKNGSISLPQNVSEEYRKHIKDPTRIYKEDQNGNPIGIYAGKEDHFAHAQTYSEIALPLAASLASNKDISNFL